ncbi:putative F-box/FBD/LRR-repeat protein At3g49040 [Cannabis sativa]|uniref:putative F-box/FBD/LRR-repeat protein At3g49040 n=1 Tax=Cannabis sativa TaxID=3483 RepID=UPI0029CA7EA8|nr:putative F-box/FBD/LRR-repeat protein At3g49040 [Cannabis sativa]
MASKKRVRPVQKKRLKTTSSSSSSSSSAEDRISRIPDALILHILSFLPTVDAVSTSFLSNRWKRMCSNLLQIRSSSLKFLEIRLVEIHWILKQIEAINLESLELNGVCFGSLNLSVGKAITNLSLSCDWRMKESSSLLEYFISNLPLLENLTLGNSGIGSLKHIKLSNQHLKSFNVNNPYDDEMTVIRAKETCD